MLFGDFAEARVTDWEEVVDEEERGEDFGYLSDSDLEDDEDETERQVDSFGLPDDKDTLG